MIRAFESRQSEMLQRKIFRNTGLYTNNTPIPDSYLGIKMSHRFQHLGGTVSVILSIQLQQIEIRDPNDLYEHTVNL